MAIVSLTPSSYGLEASNVRDYLRVFKLTIKCCSEVLSFGLKSKAIIGVHPVEVLRLNSMGIDLTEAESLIKSAYSMAGEMVSRGLAHGLGEVGLPHFKVDEIVRRACVRILRHVLLIAKDLDCVVHVHSSRGVEDYRLIKELASEIGLNNCFHAKSILNPRIIEDSFLIDSPTSPLQDFYSKHHR